MLRKKTTSGERSGYEWCRMWGIVMYDPIGWTADDGVDFEVLIEYDDFYARLQDSECKYYRDKVPLPEMEI